MRTPHREVTGKCGAVKHSGGNQETRPIRVTSPLPPSLQTGQPENHLRCQPPGGRLTGLAQDFLLQVLQGASLVAQLKKNLPAMQETLV